GVSEAGQLEDALAALEQRLQSQPADLEGWLLLARTYKTMQQHETALAALRQAQSLDPDNPLVRVELAESLIFPSGGAPASDEVRQLLQSAVEAEPELQKGLWLLGVIAAQDGNDPVAIDYWQQLLVKLDPQGGVAQAVQREVDAARERLGMVRLDDDALPPLHPPVADAPAADAPAPAATAATGTVTEMAAAKETASHPVTPPAMQDGWGGVTATVSAPSDLGSLPPTAALFLIARDPAAPNPPLGAVRIANPVFPVNLRLTDANSMMAARPISGVPEVEITARLSMSGSPMPNATDPRSEPTMIDTGAPTQLQLSLSRP
ncbi:MAG: tetratricopeptide repeat protein, partial [Gammaproteobacteria bacterium]